MPVLFIGQMPCGGELSISNDRIKASIPKLADSNSHSVIWATLHEVSLLVDRLGVKRFGQLKLVTRNWDFLSMFKVRRRHGFEFLHSRVPFGWSRPDCCGLSCCCHGLSFFACNRTSF